MINSGRETMTALKQAASTKMGELETMQRQIEELRHMNTQIQCERDEMHKTVVDNAIKNTDRWSNIIYYSLISITYLAAGTLAYVTYVYFNSMYSILAIILPIILQRFGSRCIYATLRGKMLHYFSNKYGLYCEKALQIGPSCQHALGKQPFRFHT